MRSWGAITSENRIKETHTLIDKAWLRTGHHWELNRSSVLDTENVSTSKRFNDGEEWTGKSIISIKLDDLLVVVWTLQQLKSGIEWTPIGLDHNLDSLDVAWEWERFQSASLHH
jgi:hypothetical protein